MELKDTPTAHEWLTQLSNVLNTGQCKKQGAQASLEEGFQAFQEILKKAQSSGASVWWVGNGGSSSICSHLSQDLINKLGIRSHTFSDASLITCMANDYGYENVYTEPLKKMAKKGDVLICISSSGKSKNILNSARLGSEMGMKTVTLSAFDTANPLWNFSADVSFYLPSHWYGIVEIGHSALIHAAVESLVLAQEKSGRSSP